MTTGGTAIPISAAKRNRRTFHGCNCTAAHSTWLQSKAAEDSHTPGPGGNACGMGTRASVLECGCPLPLSVPVLLTGTLKSHPLLTDVSDVPGDVGSRRVFCAARPR